MPHLLCNWFALFFPTCQARVVKIYVLVLLRLPDGSVPCRTSTASADGQCSPPDLDREFRVAMFPPDLNRELQLADFPAGRRQRASAGSVPHRTSSQKICEIERQKECQKLMSEDMQKVCQMGRLVRAPRRVRRLHC